MAWMTRMRMSRRWKRGLTLAVLAVCLGGFAAPTTVARADEAPGAEPRGALEAGLSALRVRMQAKLKEAELLERAGRLEEALAATRAVERMYREGLAELAALVRPGGAAGPGTPRPASPPPPAPPAVPAPQAPSSEGSRPGDEALAEGPERNPPPPFVSGFRGRGGASSAGTGGKRPEDEAVLHALRWLVAHQSPDGGWQADGFDAWCDGKANAGEQPTGHGKVAYDVGVTGLALSAFLGAGYTFRGDHEFSQAVRRGLAYLKNMQDPEGCFGPRVTQHYFYNHASACLAMVEAYGMTGSPIFKGSAQKGLDFIALSRNPYFGWRYGVKPGDNDTSSTAWAAMALRSARIVNDADALAGRAASFTIDTDAFAGVRAWLDKMTDPDTGRVGYITRGTGSARSMELVDRFPIDKVEAMTAVGVLLRILMGADPSQSDPVRKGAELLRRLPPVWNATDGSIDMYYWYYGALATYQVGGDGWRTWDTALAQQVVANQRRDGTYCGFKGSWDPIDPWGAEGGRVYSTAMLAMCCQVARRYERVRAPR